MKLQVQGYRLSIQQKVLWLLHQPAIPQLHVRLLLEGPLQKQRLTAALAQLLSRHEILRTRFECLGVMDVPVQVVLEPSEVHLPKIDLTRVDDEQRLSHDEVFAARLVRLAEQEHVLELSLSALCADGWSAAGLLQELAQLYASDGDESALSEVGVQLLTETFRGTEVA